MTFGFGKDRRMRKRADFLRAQSKGERISTRHFTLMLYARGEEGPSRLGLVVTKKIGGAVERNRIKRLCRECFRTWPELVPNGIDFVVIARAGAELLSLEDVRAEWRNARGALRKGVERAQSR